MEFMKLDDLNRHMEELQLDMSAHIFDIRQYQRSVRRDEKLRARLERMSQDFTSSDAQTSKLQLQIKRLKEEYHLSVRVSHLTNFRLLQQLKATVIDKEDTKQTDHRDLITRLYDKLVDQLSVQRVADQMFQQNALTVPELEAIQQKQNSASAAARILLDIVRDQPYDVYECFLSALRCEQSDVHWWLISNGCKECEPNTEHAKQIRVHYVFLVETVDPESGLINDLYAKRVLNLEEKQDIEAQPTLARKNRTLLLILCRKTPDEFKNFLDALDRTQQTHVRRELQSSRPDCIQRLMGVERVPCHRRNSSMYHLRKKMRNLEQELTEFKAKEAKLNKLLDQERHRAGELQKQLDRIRAHDVRGHTPLSARPPQQRPPTSICAQQNVLTKKGLFEGYLTPKDVPHSGSPLAAANSTGQRSEPGNSTSAAEPPRRSTASPCPPPNPLCRVGQRSEQLANSTSDAELPRRSTPPCPPPSPVCRVPREVEFFTPGSPAEATPSGQYVQLENRARQPLTGYWKPQPPTPQRTASLLQSISTKNEVLGVAEISNRIFVACQFLDSIHVFGAVAPFNQLDDVRIPGLRELRDIAACVITGRVYVADLGAGCLWRISVLPDAKVDRWTPKSPVDGSTTSFDPRSLSISPLYGRLLVTNLTHILVYRPDGAEVARIALPRHMNVKHAVENPWGETFFVSHTDTMGGTEHDQLSEVDRGGRVVRAFGGHRGDGPERMNLPIHVTVDPGVGKLVLVADYYNDRILALDEQLKCGQQGAVRGDCAVEKPRRVCYVVRTGHLLVGETNCVKVFSY